MKANELAELIKLVGAGTGAQDGAAIELRLHFANDYTTQIEASVSLLGDPDEEVSARGDDLAEVLQKLFVKSVERHRDLADRHSSTVARAEKYAAWFKGRIP